MPKKSPYSQTPAVSAKKVAGTNPVGMVFIGSGMPGMVPKSTNYSRGIMPKNEFSQPKSHGFGYKLKHRKGHHRMSGNSNAHQVGKK